MAALRERFGAPIVFVGLPPMGRFTGLPQPLRFALGVRAALLDRVLVQASSVIEDVFWFDATASFNEKHLAIDGYHPGESGCEICAEQIVSLLSSEALFNQRDCKESVQEGVRSEPVLSGDKDPWR